MMADSGARGNYSQITQLAGMRGLMTNTKGEIIDEPVKSNFMEGLSVLEYFTSTHGARKGQADTALRTADSGYLTRRLVDVSQDVVINDEDCGTEGYVELPLYLKGGRATRTIPSRPATCARDLVNPETGEVVAEAGTDITPSLLASWQEELPRETLVPVRTPSKCESPQGVCQAATAGRSPPTGPWTWARPSASSRPSPSASRARSSRCAPSTPAVSPARTSRPVCRGSSSSSRRGTPRPRPCSRTSTAA